MSTSSESTTTTERVVLEPRIAASLLRYRISAYVVGIGLLALCVGMVLEYGFDNVGPVAIIAPLHGFLYMVYIALTVDLALKTRWSIGGAIVVLICGTIPFVSFVAERSVHRRLFSGRTP